MATLIAITSLIMTMRLYTELIAYATVFFTHVPHRLINLWVYLPFNYDAWACSFPSLKSARFMQIESFFTAVFAQFFFFFFYFSSKFFFSRNNLTEHASA